jgi:hypothetical protein
MAFMNTPFAQMLGAWRPCAPGKITFGGVRSQFSIVTRGVPTRDYSRQIVAFARLTLPIRHRNLDA